ncbi:hypothetical protein HOA55_03140 [archaeon]|jgi:hypothetical protein|nr:hypothetical protein [archaeon]MBT3577432.1 hypothetical protein [archaeon]MBT6820325.1 hypothetical protein [archaeon]MBT6956124.1 hypothetical protein [archaeon]MBT7025139.1 hypothetical protein [archaeon]
MKYIEAPEIYGGKDKSLFLAGGISNCPNWQEELANHLNNEDLVLLNPRRANFPINDSSAAEKQIQWEFNHLRKATAVSFWFPKETLCPIVLCELGAWSMTDKPLFIGIDPEYPRKQDVEIQTKLARPDIKIVYDLKSLSEQIRGWANKE